MWCWGDNGRGQVGDGTTTSRSNPTQVGSSTNWTTVLAARAVTCGRRSDQTGWCWGTNSSGQWGNGAQAHTGTSPTQVTTGISSIRPSKQGIHTCIVRTDGTIACAGGNGHAQLGVADFSGVTSVTGTWRN